MQVKIYYMDGTIYEGELKDALYKVLHREDGPAIEFSGGYKEWWLNGKRHREDGPAVEHINGYYWEWWLNGQLHREDGPAIEYHDGDIMWWLDGQEYAQEDFNNILKEIDALEPTIGLLDTRKWVRNRWKRKLDNAR